MQLIKYKPAKFGLGTESSQNLQPLDFSPSVINRFYTLLGDLQKRPGLQQLGTQITSAFGVTASARITNIHEYIDSSGNSTLFASGVVDTGSNRYGDIWRYNETSAYWQEIFSSSTLAKDPNGQIFGVQMNDKLIFCNGIDRNFYVDHPSAAISANYTQQLYSTITKGITASGTNSVLLFDSDISNWRTQTNAAQNDLVYTIISGQSVGGIVTSVGTSSLDITNIGVSGNGLGLASSNLTSGLPYRLIDLVELNIIPSQTVGGTIYDNVAVGGASTSAKAVSVTALNFSNTDARAGDYIYNTTKAAVDIITTVTSNLALANGVSGQAAGDSFVFLKDAMPIATYSHVHYGQLYLIDGRDKTKIRVSGPNDPEDFTTFSKTLSSSTLDYGSRQAKGDILLTMGTFQRYFVVGGQQNLYVVDGTIPIAEVTADVVNLTPAGLFPQGIVSPRGLANIGNEMLYLGRDGLRSFLAAYSSNNTTGANKSEQIKAILTQLIAEQIDNTQNMQLIHYPRRNWVIIKIADNMYNYNYTPLYQFGQSIYSQGNYSTITQFSGLLAQQDAFYVKHDGTLITGDESGKIYQFDVNSISTDNGTSIFTSYTSPWHTLQEGQTDITLLNKDGRYIKPVFETYGEIEYNISVVGDYNRLATDSIVVTAQGAGIVGISQVGDTIVNNTTITNPKVPLRWRGEQCQITIETSSQGGNDIINSYTIYGNVFGRR